MERRMAAVFALGFASGMVVVALMFGLWSSSRATQAREDVVMAAPSAPAPVFAPEPRTPVGLPPTAEVARMPSELHPSGGQQSDIHQSDSHQSDSHLAMPLANVEPKKLQSTFSQARNGHAHEALDIMALRGTPVFAVAEGNVVKLFNSKQGGLTVYQFDDSRTWCYYYAHLDRYETGLKEGMLLRQGDVLGYVGSTGDASPDTPHLHFAVFQLGPEKQWWKGAAVDPLPLLK